MRSKRRAQRDSTDTQCFELWSTLSAVRDVGLVSALHRLSRLCPCPIQSHACHSRFVFVACRVVPRYAKGLNCLLFARISLARDEAKRAAQSNQHCEPSIDHRTCAVAVVNSAAKHEDSTGVGVTSLIAAVLSRSLGADSSHRSSCTEEPKG